MGFQPSMKNHRRLKKSEKNFAISFGTMICRLIITVKANIAKVNFLYVTLNLKAGKHYPYNKGNILLYVHKRPVAGVPGGKP